MSTPVVVSETLIRGRVESVGDDSFTVDTGTKSLKVTTDALGDDPLDDEGHQRIESRRVRCADRHS